MKYPDDFMNKIICGDCLEVMKEIPNERVDLILTDPFYVPPNIFQWKNFDDFYWEFNKEWLLETKRIVKKNYHFFITFSSEDMARFESLLKELNFDIKSRIVWHYRNAGGRCRAQDRFGKTYEFIFHCSKDKNLNFPEKWDDKRFDVQTMAIPQSNFKEGKYHQFQKPLNLIKRLIEFGSNENEIILDPFIGSGTTALACKEMNRNFIGIEINPDYCKIAEERLAQGIL